MIWRSVFPDAVIRYREMRLSDSVTRGRGLSIHRTDCINMIHLSEAERARLIPAEWETEVTGKNQEVSILPRSRCMPMTSRGF